MLAAETRSKSKACDQRAVQRVRTALAGVHGIAERQMADGVCFALNGHMALGIVGTDLLVHIGLAGYEQALRQPHVQEMDFEGRAMRGYVFVGALGFAHEASLQRWIEVGVNSVLARYSAPG